MLELKAHEESSMSQVDTAAEVLTLEEAADYLRLAVEVVEQEANQGVIPARSVAGQWRFLKAALNDWLRGQDHRSVLLKQAGAFADDDTLGALLQNIYAHRGRTEV
jgi:excisionase family DNA binding protein